MRNWQQCKIIKNYQWCEGLYSLFIAAKLPVFSPGQFVHIGWGELKIRPELYRAYSLASHPQENEIEIYYNWVENGHLTPKLSQLKEGENVWVGEPRGKFNLDSVGDASHLWLISTGTGLAPFLSMLKSDIIWQRFKKIILIQSVRKEEQLTHQESMQLYSNQSNNQFYFVPIVTQQKESQFYSSRVSHLLQEKTLENRLNLNMHEDSQVMLCGNPSMVKEVADILSERGLNVSHGTKPGRIHLENYWKA